MKKSIGWMLLSVVLIGCGINNELHYTNNDVSHSFPDSLHNTDIPADDINSLSTVYETVEIETKKHALNESLNVITNSIDIQYLFGQRSPLFDEINYLFGNHIGYVEISPSPEYIFDTRVIVTPSYLGWVQSIIVDYRQPNFNFNGIDGNSTYAEVISIFGEPHNVRAGVDEERIGAVKSYLYPVFENQFGYVRFFFDSNDIVIRIDVFS